MIKVGDKVHKPLTGILYMGKGNTAPKFWGRVVWIHPERRFYVAEFATNMGSVRECFTDGLW